MNAHSGVFVDDRDEEVLDWNDEAGAWYDGVIDGYDDVG
jgi:hypothetical protein